MKKTPLSIKIFFVAILIGIILFIQGLIEATPLELLFQYVGYMIITLYGLMFLCYLPIICNE